MEQRKLIDDRAENVLDGADRRTVAIGPRCSRDEVSGSIWEGLPHG